MGDDTRSRTRVPKRCQVPGCEIEHTLIRYGMCPKHYTRLRRNGSEHAQKTVTPGVKRHWLEMVAASEHGDQCIDWPFKVNVDGYGVFFIGRKLHRANRWIMQHTGHDVPADAYVCHTCHNRRCVNPNHLYVGDHESNTADMVRSGRAARGEGSATSRLTADEVREIRRRAATGAERQRDIAADFGVSKGAVAAIVAGRNWGWLK